MRIFCSRCQSNRDTSVQEVGKTVAFNCTVCGMHLGTDWAQNQKIYNPTPQELLGVTSKQMPPVSPQMTAEEVKVARFFWKRAQKEAPRATVNRFFKEHGKYVKADIDFRGEGSIWKDLGTLAGIAADLQDAYDILINLE